MKHVYAVLGTCAIVARFVASRWGAVLPHAELQLAAVIGKVAIPIAGVPEVSWSTGAAPLRCRLAAN